MDIWVVFTFELLWTNLFLDLSKFIETPSNPQARVLHVLRLSDLGSFSSVVPLFSTQDPYIHHGKGKRKATRTHICFWVLWPGSDTVASAYSLLSRSRHIALYSHRGSGSKLFLWAQKDEKENQILADPSNVYLWQANNLASL